MLYSRPGGPLVPEAEWAALVGRIAGGDQAALQGLYQRARRPVFTLAVRITGSRETAEELLVDVFHEAWSRASSYDPANGTVLGWIMNIARSRSIDRLRFEQSLKRTPGAQEAHEEDPVLDPRELLELKERGETLRSALEALSPEEREAVRFAFLAGFTHAEVAERLGEPLGTVKSRIRSGLEKLRRQLRSGL